MEKLQRNFDLNKLLKIDENDTSAVAADNDFYMKESNKANSTSPNRVRRYSKSYPHKKLDSQSALELFQLFQKQSEELMIQ